MPTGSPTGSKPLDFLLFNINAVPPTTNTPGLPPLVQPGTVAIYVKPGDKKPYALDETGTETPAFFTGTFTAAPVPSTAGGVALGSGALPFSGVFVGGAATNNIQLTGTATTAKTATFPDNTGTVAELNLAQTWTAAETFAPTTAVVPITISPTTGGASALVINTTGGNPVIVANSNISNYFLIQDTSTNLLFLTTNNAGTFVVANANGIVPFTVRGFSTSQSVDLFRIQQDAGGGTAIATLDFAGKVTRWAGIVTQGLGLPIIPASVAVATTNVGVLSATAFTGANLPAGRYRITWYANTNTTLGASPTFTFRWTDNQQAQSIASAALGTAVGSLIQGTAHVSHNGSANITYEATTNTSGTYSYYLNLERLA